MLDNTIAIIDKTVNDIKKAAFIVQLSFYSFIVLSLIYKLFTQEEIILNFILLVLSSLCLILFIINHYHKNPKIKKALKDTRKIYHKTKIAVQLISFIIVLTSVAFVGTATIALSIIALFSILGWVLSLILEIVSNFVEKRLQMFTDALKMDFEPISNPLNGTANLVRQAFGKEPVYPQKIKYEKQIKNLASVHKEERAKIKEEKRIEREKRFNAFKEKLKIHK